LDLATVTDAMLQLPGYNLEGRHDRQDQCCQLLAKRFGQSNQNVRPLAQKFGPLQNLFITANITVNITPYFSQQRERKIKDKEMKCTFQQIS
jgi:hypothetical protein